jgi:regulator of sigma E protease
MITYWVLFVVLFGVVVFVHELGHFLVAKRTGVFVERFAIGFGPALLKRKWGETEYAICAFPLGGYVKMRGEDPDEAARQAPDPRSFSQIPPQKRIAIAMMGPISNLVLPVVVFTALFVVGMPTLVSRIGWVGPGSPAEQAGLKAGDRVVAVDGSPVWKWADLEETIRRNPGRAIPLEVRRGADRLTVRVVPRAESDSNLFGETVSVGKVGISPAPMRPAVGVVSAAAPAHRAGFRTGDVITAVNGRAVTYAWEVEEAFAASAGPKRIAVERDGAAKEFLLPAGFRTPRAAGFEDGELYIREVREGSVAAEKGIRTGDRLDAVNGAPIESWTVFQQMVRANEGEPLVLRLLRDGKPVEIKFVPQEVTDRNTLTQQREKRRQLGVVSAAVPGEVLQMPERYLNPFVALGHGLKTTWEMTVTTVVGLGKLLTGQLSVKKSLGGPISIFYLAGGSYETGGWVSFFRMMAILSITLGVINFLPIPVLDGGHLLFFAIEWIRGAPVNLKVRELAQQVGLILIIGLMLLTFYVDIERYFFDRILALFN